MSPKGERNELSLRAETSAVWDLPRIRSVENEKRMKRKAPPLPCPSECSEAGFLRCQRRPGQNPALSPCPSWVIILQLLQPGQHPHCPRSARDPLGWTGATFPCCPSRDSQKPSRPAIAWGEVCSIYRELAGWWKELI